MTSASFHDLSSPILSQILDHFSTSDLPRFAILSKLTREAVAGLLLQRFGIQLQAPLVYLNFDSESNPDGLLAISLAAPQSLPSVRCWFSPCTNISCLTGEINRLVNLISRLEKVGEITLALEGESPDFSSSSDEYTSNKWHTALEQLRLAARKASCSRIVHQDDMMTRTYAPRTPKSILARFAPSLPRMIGLARRAHEPPNASELTLSSLSIRSRILLTHPPAFDRLLYLFRSSELSQITLGKVEMTGFEWAEVLPQLAKQLQHIRHLTISAPSIFTTDVINILMQLPNLVVLALDRSMVWYRPENTKLQQPSLPHLVEISAPMEYISNLLTSSRALLALQRLEIRLPNLTHVVSDYTAERFSQILGALQRRRIKAKPRVSAFAWPGSIAYELSRNMDASFSVGEVWKQSFGQISEFAFVGSLDLDLTHQVNLALVLPRWLAMFPALKVIAFDLPTSGLSSIESFINATSSSTQLQFVDVAGQRFPMTLSKRPMSFVSSSGPDLSRLPEDVLRIVFDHLDVELLHISTLSKQLNLVALPIYLKQHGISDPSRKVVISLQELEMRADALRGLESAFWIESVDSIECTFEKMEHVHFIFNQVSRLQRFISTLTSVKSIAVVFKETEYSDHAAGDPLLGHWVHLFGSLLDAILSKSPTSLSLTGPHLFLKSYMLSDSDFYFFPPAHSSLRGPDWRFVRRADLGRKSPLVPLAQLPSRFSLKKLILNGKTFLHPPYLPWTISVLQSTSITSLKFTYVTLELGRVLRVAMSSIPSSLEDLSLSGFILSTDLLDILKKTPDLLVSLSIGSGCFLNPNEDVEPLSGCTLSFQRLAVLSAPVGLIDHLLNRPNPLPRLAKLTVMTKTRLEPHRDIQALMAHLGSAGLRPELSLDIEGYCITRMHQDISETPDNARSSSVHEALKPFTSIRLRDKGPALLVAHFHPDAPAEIIPAWLGRFLNLRHVLLEEHEASDRRSVMAAAGAIRALYPHLTVELGEGDAEEPETHHGFNTSLWRNWL